MNHLEDEFWIARAAGLARRVGPRGHAAVLVRRGRSLGEHVARNAAGPWAWIETVAGPNGGGTLYLSFAPSPAVIEAGRRARVARIIHPESHGEVAGASVMSHGERP